MHKDNIIEAVNTWTETRDKILKDANRAISLYNDMVLECDMDHLEDDLIPLVAQYDSMDENGVFFITQDGVRYQVSLEAFLPFRALAIDTHSDWAFGRFQAWLRMMQTLPATHGILRENHLITHRKQIEEEFG